MVYINYLKKATIKIKDKTLKKLKALLHKESIDTKLYYYLTSIDLSGPRFYSQPQINKLQIRK